MGASDDGNNADVARRQEEIAKKYARLDDPQRQEFHKSVDRAIEANGGASDHYRLDVINTLLQPIPAREQARQIKEAERNEKHRSYRNEQRIERGQPAVAKHADQDQAGPAHNSGQQATATPRKLDNPLEGVRPSGPLRNYSELQKTHEQVAAKQNADQGTAAEPATAPLSKEQLQAITQRCAETRKAHNLEPTTSDLRERNELTKMHTAAREKLDRAHGAAPNEQKNQQVAMLDHQQLAERLGAEARSIGQHLRRQGVPGAESFEHDARHAHHTARLVHEKRQNLGRALDRVQDPARIVRQQEQQKQADAQEAARGGSKLTSEQRANASPDVQRTLDRKDRTDAIRNGGARPGERRTQGNAKPANARPRGHSR